MDMHIVCHLRKMMKMMKMNELHTRDSRDYVKIGFANVLIRVVRDSTHD